MLRRDTPPFTGLTGPEIQRDLTPTGYSSPVTSPLYRHLCKGRCPMSSILSTSSDRVQFVNHTVVVSFTEATSGLHHAEGPLLKIPLKLAYQSMLATYAPVSRSLIAFYDCSFYDNGGFSFIQKMSSYINLKTRHIGATIISTIYNIRDRIFLTIPYIESAFYIM